MQNIQFNSADVIELLFRMLGFVLILLEVLYIEYSNNPMNDFYLSSIQFLY